MWPWTFWHKVLPIEIKGITLIVATNNPLDVSGLQEIQYMSGLPGGPVIAGREDIETHLKIFRVDPHGPHDQTGEGFRG